MRKILIIDDNKYMKIALSMLLEESGFEPQTADDGASALDNIKTDKPSLVFLDKKLPDYDGITLLREIKCFDEKIPVIMLTAYSEQSYADEAINNGAFAFVTKPFNNEELISIIEKALTTDGHSTDGRK